MDFRFYIDFGNGFVPVTQPRNAEAMRLELLWSSPSPSFSLQSINFEWLGETATGIYDYRLAGLTGGYGIYFGLPLKVEPCDTTLDSIYLLLNLIDESAVWECGRVVCPLLDKAKKDWLNDIAASFTFSYLASTESLASSAAGFTPITLFDYKRTPYCISEIPDYTTVASLTVNLFIIGYELVDKTIKLGDDITKFTGDVGALAFALVAVGLEEIVRVILDAIRILVDMALIALLVDMFIDTLIDIKNHIIQSKKFKFCMREKDLFLKACAYLGLTFSSTIFQSGSPFENATWMPSKIVQPKEFSGLGLNLFTYDRPEDEAENFQKSYGYFDGTFKDFIEKMKIKYNAEEVVYNGVLYFEMKHGYNNSSNYIIPNTGEVGYTFNLPAPSGTNAHELPHSYMLQFAVDESELNTLHKYEGTTCQYQIDAFNPGDSKNKLGTHGVVVDIPCALGKRKDYYTRPEQWLIDNKAALDTTAQGVEVLLQTTWLLMSSLAFGVPGLVIGALTLPHLDNIPTVDVSDRMGWLLLSNDSFSVPKTFIGEQRGDEWVVHPSSFYVMSAEHLMRYCHRYNLGTHGNQWLTYKDKRIPFCCEDFQTVMGNNIFKTVDNKKAKIKRILWNPFDEVAEEVEYWVNELFDKNMMKETISINGEVHG